MKLGKNVIAIIAAASLGLCVSAMAQGRPASHPGGGPGMGGPGMGGPGMAGPSGMGGPMGRMGGPGTMGQAGQMGQYGQMRTQSGRKSASQMLTTNTKLATHLASTLGMTPQQLVDGSSGYKNLGLYVASLHVSKNLGISLKSLQQAMTANKGNLGKAIHSLDPSLSKKQVKDAVKTAKHQAKNDIKHSRG